MRDISSAVLVVICALALSGCVRARGDVGTLPDRTTVRGPQCWADSSSTRRFEIRRASAGTGGPNTSFARIVVLVTGGPLSEPIRWATAGTEQRGATTDSTGVAVVDSLPEGPARIGVRAIGYEWSFRRVTLRLGYIDTVAVGLRMQTCV